MNKTIKAKPPRVIIALEEPLQKLGRELSTYLRNVRDSENIVHLATEADKLDKLAA